jgi:hypothetical protein
MKIHLPEVFVLDVDLDHDFKIYALDGVITTNCLLCSPQECLKNGHSNRGLQIISLKDENPNIPYNSSTEVIPKEIWFQEVCKTVVLTLQNMWDIWELELFQGNKNIFLIRKDLEDGTYETGLAGREGDATIPPDTSFEKHIQISEFRYAKLAAFW